MSVQNLLVVAAVSPFACMVVTILYLQGKGWQIYRRIDNHSIGLTTFFIQLENQGWNFPGPNVLEAELAKQPADLQAEVEVFRRRMRYLRWGALLYIGFLFTALFLARKLGS
jgi:hypothetical protein